MPGLRSALDKAVREAQGATVRPVLACLPPKARLVAVLGRAWPRAVSAPRRGPVIDPDRLRDNMILLLRQTLGTVSDGLTNDDWKALSDIRRRITDSRHPRWQRLASSLSSLSKAAPSSDKG